MPNVDCCAALLVLSFYRSNLAEIVEPVDDVHRLAKARRSTRLRRDVGCGPGCGRAAFPTASARENSPEREQMSRGGENRVRDVDTDVENGDREEPLARMNGMTG